MFYIWNVYIQLSEDSILYIEVMTNGIVTIKGCAIYIINRRRMYEVVIEFGNVLLCTFYTLIRIAGRMACNIGEYRHFIYLIQKSLHLLIYKKKILSWFR